MDNSKSLLPRILEMNQRLNLLDTTCHMRKTTEFSEIYRTKGNELYGRGKHNRAEHKLLISLYTASISCAPKDSEDLAKGFGNRSAALMHMHRYKEALVDIDRALLVSKSDDYKKKLESRRERCLNLVDESNVKLPDELPKMLSSEKLPNASEAVDVAYNEKLGGHLVAAQDIEPGQVIVAEEGYVCFPDYDRLHFICSHCLRFAWNGIPCETCVLTIFCSEECKKEAWDEYHDVECSIIRAMFLITGEDALPTAMVIVRSFIKAVKTEGLAAIIDEAKRSGEQNDGLQKLLSDGILDRKKFRSYYNLSHKINDEKAKDEKCTGFNTALLLITMLHRYTTVIPIGKLEDFDSVDNELVMTLIKVIMRLDVTVSNNNFVYQAPFCDCIDIHKCRGSCDMNRGKLLAATCSLISHSCCPNVNRLFLPGKKVVMFTTASVKKGEKLCNSYGPVYHQSKVERQEYLKEKYDFLCSCKACEEDWSQDISEELYKNPIVNMPNFEKFIIEMKKILPDWDLQNQQLSFVNILFGSMYQRYPEKSVLEIVQVVSSLIYKYFNYQSAYSHCLQLSLYTENAFSKFYGENCLIPDSC